MRRSSRAVRSPSTAWCPRSRPRAPCSTCGAVRPSRSTATATTSRRPSPPAARCCAAMRRCPDRVRSSCSSTPWAHPAPSSTGSRTSPRMRPDAVIVNAGMPGDRAPARDPAHARREPPRGRGRERTARLGSARVIVLSLQSGTSADGIDVAVVEFGATGDAAATGRVHLTVLHAETVDWEAELRAQILAVAAGEALDAGAFTRLTTRLGQAFAEAAARGIRASGVTPDLVVSHGQTVYHWVESGHARGTLQLGDPAWITERTGVPVLSDVRMADIAAGGEGAPLMAAFDRAWLGADARAARPQPRHRQPRRHRERAAHRRRRRRRRVRQRAGQLPDRRRRRPALARRRRLRRRRPSRGGRPRARRAARRSCCGIRTSRRRRRSRPGARPSTSRVVDARASSRRARSGSACTTSSRRSPSSPPARSSRRSRANRRRTGARQCSSARAAAP